MGTWMEQGKDSGQGQRCPRTLLFPEVKNSTRTRIKGSTPNWPTPQCASELVSKKKNFYRALLFIFIYSLFNLSIYLLILFHLFIYFSKE